MDIAQLIQNFGFPVACVIALAWYLYKQSLASREDTAKREERMFSQLDKFGDSLNSFNDTLKSIDSRLGKVEDKLKED